MKQPDPRASEKPFPPPDRSPLRLLGWQLTLGGAAALLGVLLPPPFGPPLLLLTVGLGAAGGLVLSLRGGRPGTFEELTPGLQNFAAKLRAQAGAAENSRQKIRERRAALKDGLTGLESAGKALEEGFRALEQAGAEGLEEGARRRALIRGVLQGGNQWSALAEEAIPVAARTGEGCREFPPPPVETPPQGDPLRPRGFRGKADRAGVEEALSSGETMEKLVRDLKAGAFQTKLLSMITFIEAARTGEGAGFNIVAREVRRLAEAQEEAAAALLRLVRGFISQTLSPGPLPAGELSPRVLPPPVPPEPDRRGEENQARFEALSQKLKARISFWQEEARGLELWGNRLTEILEGTAPGEPAGTPISETLTSFFAVLPPAEESPSPFPAPEIRVLPAAQGESAGDLFLFLSREVFGGGTE